MKSIEYEIRIPKTKDDFRIKHYKALQNPLVFSDESLSTKLDFLCDLTGCTLNQLKLLRPEQIAKVYNRVLLSFRDFKLGSEPPKELTINGKEYYRVNPEKVGIGWHIDYSNKDITKDNVKLACLFYHPKGFKYGEVDENDNLLNPIKDRYDDFAEHFPLVHFIEASAFFLKWRVRSMRIYMVRERTKRTIMRIIKFLRLGRGKKASL